MRVIYPTNAIAVLLKIVQSGKMVLQKYFVPEEASHLCTSSIYPLIHGVGYFVTNIERCRILEDVS
jgi:hypothetical protein